ncbi:MAG: phytanoyl-CoA dioxygenase family protein [Armatimonadetes bacterium]|nr:phytanoyl-CoA dioxygenase family protein [Armatimonadota bacterium]
MISDLAPSPPQVAQYRRDGYFLLEDLVSRAERDAILGRLAEYVRGDRPAPPGFGTQVEPRVARGELQADPDDPLSSLRKINGPVPGDDLLTALVTKPRLVAAMQAIMSPNLKLFRADFLMKPPFVGSAKGVHQDSPYWPIEPMDLASCWIAFDDATVTNGCLTVVPGSHLRGPLPHVSVTDDYVVPEEHYVPAELIPVEMRAGTGLVFHSLLLHGSAPNESPRPRRAVTISIMPAEARYTRDSKPEYYGICGVDVPGGV